MLLIVVSCVHVSAEELSNRSETSGESGRRKIEIDGTQAVGKGTVARKRKGEREREREKEEEGSEGREDESSYVTSVLEG